MKAFFLAIAAISAALCCAPAGAAPADAGLAPGAQTGAEKVRVRVRFFADGLPVKAELTIARERDSTRFTSRSSIDAVVPRRATWTISADLAGAYRPTFRDVIADYELLADGADLEIHFPNADIRNYAPFALIRTAGSKVAVANWTSADPERRGAFDLTTRVTASPQSRFILDTYLPPAERSAARICAAPCPHAYPQAAGVDCSVHCVTCSTTADTSGPYVRENFNLCEIKAPGGGGGGVSDEPDETITIASRFQPMPRGHGGVTLASLRRDHAAVKPTFVELRAGGAAAVPYTARQYPEFVAPQGPHILSVEIPGWLPADASRRFAVPVAAVAGRTIAVSLDLGVSAFEVGEAKLFGDTRLGLALAGVVIRPVAAGVWRLTTEMDEARDDQGWVAVRLPLTGEAPVVRRISGKRSKPLVAGSDFTVSDFQGDKLLILRVGVGTQVHEIAAK